MQFGARRCVMRDSFVGEHVQLVENVRKAALSCRYSVSRSENGMSTAIFSDAQRAAAFSNLPDFPPSSFCYSMPCALHLLPTANPRCSLTQLSSRKLQGCSAYLHNENESYLLIANIGLTLSMFHSHLQAYQIDAAFTVRLAFATTSNQRRSISTTTSLDKHEIAALLLCK